MNSPHLVLVVDDDAQSRKLMTMALRSWGFDVLEARNGLEALNLLQTHIPTIIVLDMLLPLVQGTEVLRTIYADPRLSDVRVIIVTAQDRFRSLSLRSSDRVFVKPVSLRDINQQVNTWVSPGHAPAL